MERMREQLGRFLDRGREQSGKPRVPESQSFLQTVRSSSFAQMDSADRALVQGIVDQNPNSPAVTEVFDQLGLNQVRNPAERLYALRYITTVATISDLQSQATQADLPQPERDELARQINLVSTQFAAFEKDVESKSRPTHLRMRKGQAPQIRERAEDGYRAMKSARENERKYPLDDEHTAVPTLTPQQIERMLDAASGTMKSIDLAFDQLDPDSILMKVSAAISANSGMLPLMTKDELQDTFLGGMRLEVLGALKGKLMLPKGVSDILAKLGLDFDNPYHIRYALSYITRMAWIQRTKSSDIPNVTEEVSIIKRDFAQEEWFFETSSILRVSRSEMMRVRETVEEAFRTHPDAFRQEEPSVSAEDEFEEFQIIDPQIQQALRRASEDATKPALDRTYKSRFAEVLYHTAQDSSLDLRAPVSMYKQFLRLGGFLIENRLPETIKLYRSVRGNAPLPPTIQEFMEQLSPERVSSSAVRSAGITPQDIETFRKWVNREDLKGELRYVFERLTYYFIQLVDIDYRGLEVDFTNPRSYRDLMEQTLAMLPEEVKNPSQPVRNQLYDSKPTRGIVLGNLAWGSLKAYVPLDTIDRLDRITGASEE